MEMEDKTAISAKIGDKDLYTKVQDRKETLAVEKFESTFEYPCHMFGVRKMDCNKCPIEEKSKEALNNDWCSFEMAYHRMLTATLTGDKEMFEKAVEEYKKMTANVEW